MLNKDSKAWHWDFARQAVIGGDLKATEIQPFTDTSGGLYNIPAEKIQVLSLPNGNIVLGIDQFHCDIDIASVLVFVSDNGYVLNKISIDPNEGWSKIQKFGLVRHDLIGVVLDDITYYFDPNGNRVELSEPENIFSQLIALGNSFIGLIDNRIVKVDSNMFVLKSDNLSDSILQAIVYNGNKIIVINESEVLLYNDQLDLQYSSPLIANITVARESNDRIWVGTRDGLYELDSLLDIINFFPDNESEKIVWLGDWRDSLLVITQYDGLDHTDIAVRKLAPQGMISLTGPDIAITQISIPSDQRKVLSPYCPSSPGIHFDSMMITIINHSEEVVNEFKIGCDFGGPGQCRSFQKVWFVDTVSVQPHQSIDIFIDSFTMNCVFPLKFCAWTFSPNDKPDSNPANDKTCDTILILNTNPPVENRLINTTYFDTYSSHQILPDGTIRFFFHSDYRYPESTYADLKPNQSLEEVVPQTIYVPDSDYWNWSSDGLISLPFADGSTLLLNTTYPCDVAVSGSLVKINKHGGIDWFRDIDDEDYFYRAEKMMFLDSNRIGIQGVEGGMLLIMDRQGNKIAFEEATFPYSNTIETLSGYIVSKNNQLLILNKSFLEVSTYTLSGEVTRIWPQGGNEFIIKGGEKFYLLDSINQIEILALGNAHYDVVWKSKDFYWAVDRLNGHVDKFFPNLSWYLNRLLLPPGVDPIFGVTSGNNVFVLSEYLTSVSKGLLIYTGGSDNLHFRLHDDIGISAIEIPDTVHVYKSPYPIIGWTYRYDSIRVEVSNYSFDTVYHYQIQALDDLDCGWCFDIQKIWEIDAPLAPGETVSILLGAFSPRCVPYKDLPLCITTVGPDNKADKNVENDRVCQAITSIIVSTAELTSTYAFDIYPNPTAESLTISINSRLTGIFKASIFNNLGQIVGEHEIPEPSQSIPVHDLNPGLYHVHLTHEKSGHAYYSSFIKQ